MSNAKESKDLKLVIAGQEVLSLEYDPNRTSKRGNNPLPYTTHGFVVVNSKAVGSLRISINVIQ